MNHSIAKLLHALLMPLLAMLPFTTAAKSWDAAIPATSVVANGYDNIDIVKSRLAASPLNHLEGIWKLGGEQTVVAIERCPNPAIVSPGMEIYQIVIIDSPRCSITPGTTLGYAVASGRRNTYDARLYTSTIRNLLHRHARFTLTLDADETHLNLSPVKSQWKILLRNTFHFLMRIGVYHDPQVNSDINGFTRLFPASTGRPDQPVYL